MVEARGANRLLTVCAKSSKCIRLLKSSEILIMNQTAQLTSMAILQTRLLVREPQASTMATSAGT